MPYRGARNVSDCGQCRPGTRQPESGQTICISCPAGSFSEQDGATSCDECQLAPFKPPCIPSLMAPALTLDFVHTQVHLVASAPSALPRRCRAQRAASATPPTCLTGSSALPPTLASSRPLVAQSRRRVPREALLPSRTSPSATSARRGHSKRARRPPPAIRARPATSALRGRGQRFRAAAGVTRMRPISPSLRNARSPTQASSAPPAA